jgi:hypothetical protein
MAKKSSQVKQMTDRVGAFGRPACYQAIRSGSILLAEYQQNKFL